MPKRKKSGTRNVSKKRRIHTVESTEKDDHIASVFIPNPGDSGESDQSNDDCSSTSDESDMQTDLEMHEDFESHQPIQSYQKVLENYNASQKKLVEGHSYNWIDGETIHDDTLTNDILLSKKQKDKILTSSSTELFEIFFSDELKKYIIDSTAERGYELTFDRFELFLGIIIFTIFNKRLSQRDYWSTNVLLGADVVRSAMPRTEFDKIKSKIKFHKSSDENTKDKAWRVRSIMNIFNKNIKNFGYFCTALSIDEMMVKFYGRVCFKQFIRGKPIRFGIKMWALCGSNGYLFNFDLYCGKNENIDFLPKISQGSRVVLQMLHDFLTKTSPRNRLQYHIYFDNLFTSPDLLVHLKNQGVRATGTIRKDRIEVTNEIDTKARRGTFQVKHDTKTGVNFVTVMDSKPVSILSSAAGITPTSDVTRYDKEAKEKVTLSFPKVFGAYNSFMGGVDLHDQHCNHLMPIIRAKKWTWPVFIRLIQGSITNATVLYNSISDKKKGTKEVAMEICEKYLLNSKSKFKNHTLENTGSKKYCSIDKCIVRSSKSCIECEAHFCIKCFKETHE